MKCFVHRLSGSQTPWLNNFAALRARGLGALISETHSELLKFTAHTPQNTLYVDVGEVHHPFRLNDDDFIHIRRSSTMNNLNITVVKHLLEVREKWSKKFE